MSENLDLIIKKEYPNLENSAYFDYATRAPVSASQIQRIKGTSIRIQPSPHSSEEQSSFDRSLSTIREKIADIFHSSQVSYAVVIFPNRESAANAIFEGFPWKSGYNLYTDKSFKVDLSSSMKYLISANTAHDVDFKENVKALPNSLYCFEHSDFTKEKVNEIRRKSNGSQFFLCDATKLGLFELPNLNDAPYDYTLLSLRHIIGAEVCACLMKLTSADKLVPLFYGGGAVSFSCARMYYHTNFKSHTKRFENGTPSMMPIFSAVSGIDVWQEMKKDKVFALRAQEIVNALSEAASPFFNIEKLDKYSIRLTQNGMDAPKLQSLFAEKKVYLTVDGDSLIASVGIASKHSDVNMFVDAAKTIL